jgi:hypothetical protein
MAKLKAATRNKLSSSVFVLPKQRKYPMEDRTHQIKAEEFRHQGRAHRKALTGPGARIRAKAKRLLRK